MKDSVKRFLDYISSGISTVKLSITRVIPFGSYVRGEALVFSDIDSAIVCSEVLNSHFRSLLFEFLECYPQEMNYSLFWTLLSTSLQIILKMQIIILVMRELCFMKREHDYLDFAAADLRVAKLTLDAAEYNHSCRLSQQVLERCFKQIIETYGDISDAGKLFLHKPALLYKHCCTLLDLEFDQEKYRDYLVFGDYYFDLNYPGSHFSVKNKEESEWAFNIAKAVYEETVLLFRKESNEMKLF